jgi:predicted transcriptional regulator
MKTNITLKLDSDLLRQVKIWAAEDDISISAMLTERLKQMVRERETFARARKRALARLRQGMNLQWTPAHSRDQLHER